MIIFGKVFTVPQGTAVIALLVFAVFFFGFIFGHIIHRIRKDRRQPIIYLYQEHYEVRRK